MNFEFQKMFHTYDHQVVYLSMMPLSYIQEWFGVIYKALPLHYFNDFYFIGTMVLLCGLFCMFQMFFSMLDLIVADRDQHDTRIILMKKRIFELETELNSLHEEIFDLKYYVKYCLTYQDKLLSISTLKKNALKTKIL